MGKTCPDFLAIIHMLCQIVPIFRKRLLNANFILIAGKFRMHCIYIEAVSLTWHQKTIYLFPRLFPCYIGDNFGADLMPSLIAMINLKIILGHSITWESNYSIHSFLL